MSNILTAGKDIQLHEFPSLASKFSFKYVAEPRKFVVFPQENIIVSLYRDNRIDLLQAYQSNNGIDKIKRLKKLKLNGVTCAGVFSHDGKYEIALGLTNGNIEFVDFNTKTMLEKKFSSDVFGNSVVNIDFNKDYDVLASTFQSGELQLFNMKNLCKLQRHRLDMKSDIVCFHPNNQHLLAVSSLSGGLTVLDINIKRSMYSNPKAHNHYSADISWLRNSPSTLVSVGSTTMALFDTRQKVTRSVTHHPYSYSTLAISPCENFCCVGDVKGSIMSYDLRKIQTVLETNSCHEGSVTNLRFLPCSLEAELSTEDNNLEEDSDIDSVDRKKLPNRRTSAQSFFDIVAPVKQQNVDSDVDSRKKLNRRTSAQIFFDIVAPVEQEEDQCGSSDQVFTDVAATKIVLNDLKSVPEENTLSESNSSNNRSVGSSKNQDHEPLVSDDIYEHPSQQDLVSQQIYDKLNSFKELTSSNYNSNAEVPIRMNETSETFHRKLHDLEIRMNNKLMNMEQQVLEKIDEVKEEIKEQLHGMQRKLEDQMEEKREDLHDQILHGFRSIHCALWGVAESDIRDTKNMVAKIHENYSKIEDVFIENLILKEKLLKLQQ